MEKTFIGALLHYFGRKPGQTALDFQAELQQLTQEDRDWFRRELTRVGYKLTN